MTLIPNTVSRHFPLIVKYVPGYALLYEPSLLSIIVQYVLLQLTNIYSLKLLSTSLHLFVLNALPARSPLELMMLESHAHLQLASDEKTTTQQQQVHGLAMNFIIILLIILL